MALPPNLRKTAIPAAKVPPVAKTTVRIIEVILHHAGTSAMVTYCKLVDIRIKLSTQQVFHFLIMHTFG